MNGIDVLLFDR